MKKRYQKPEIMFEDFTLSTNIAGDCVPPFVTTFNDKECGIPFSDGETIFDNIGCDRPGKEFEDNNMLCYHVPTVNTALFNS